MLKAPLYDTKGEKKGDIELPESVFGVPGNDTLLHQIYVAISANLRSPIAHTKDRGERAGSGKKPWKQKGTGRARAGAVRSPLWRKGGVTFGPTKDRNFSKVTNRKMRQKALCVALSEKFRSEKLRIVDSFAFETKKTREFSELLAKLGARPGKALLGFSASERDNERMSRNIDRTTNILAENMSAYDLLNHEYLVVTKETIEMLSLRFSEKKEQPVND
ncbi:MAG: 50S ribosomal protein L4 [Candidatus Moranbacteria bacterium]|jgi:large subunit ribosomal protein L4|nr:50S ribosomal protein L4 [Candidatus Moranbacteria bacterium]